MVNRLKPDKMLRRVYRIAPLSMYEKAAELAAKLAQEKTLCDVGGGTGNLYRALLRIGGGVAYYVLVDPDPGLTMEAPKNHHVEVVHGVAEALPIRGKACNVIVFFDSLHHFSNPAKSLEEAARAAHCLVVEDIDKSKLMGKIIAWIEKLLGYPANFTTLEQLEEELSSRGFSLKGSDVSQGLMPVYRVVGCVEEHVK